MKKKKRWILAIVSIIIIALVAVVTFFLLRGNNKLTVQERNWINQNINTIQNINIVNNANVFGKNASGVFYDFLKDFSLEYGMQINPITFNSTTIPSGISFGFKNTLNENDTSFYKDHYVLVGKSNVIIKDTYDLEDKTIGVLKSNESYITSYLKNINLKSYEEDNLYAAIGSEVDYIIVPLMQDLDKILSDNLEILYHFGDINSYYVMQGNNDTLSSILNKYYQKWQGNLKEYFNEHEFTLFLNSLNISETEIDKLQSIVHNYGFVNMSPYEVIMGGKYGGINAVYLSNFSDFAKIDFNFVKYKSNEKLQEAINNRKVELYFNYYEENNGKTVVDGPIISYIVASNKDNSTVINSLNSLIGKTVYVENNSKLHEYLKTISNVKILTYNKLKEIKKVNNKEEYYLLIDKNIYLYNEDGILKNYAKRYEGVINKKYEFKVNDNEILAKLLGKYLKTLDSKEIEILGLDNHYETVKMGSIMSHIAKYIIYLILIFIIIVLLFIRKSKKITIARRIKKDDKLKFIDQLTSLKNRNYLSENISVWNNNTIYPQAIVVIDLNRLQEINDIYGYEEGDKQIQAAANALIKTQLDNSEIMRTDGNEFVIYIVGYSEKQIINYMHKLNKEINKLPYDFGAEFGHSMIMDNVKTIEDAMNEAVEDMKKQKAMENEKETKK